MDKLFYLLFLTGVILVSFPSVYWIWCICRTRFVLKRNLGRFGDEQELRNYGKIGNHLRMLIQAAEFERYFPTVERFALFSIILGSVSTIFFVSMLSWKIAALWGVFLTILPYCVLQVYLHEKRVRRSKEGDVLVQELLNNYQICHYNMTEALEKTSLSLENEPLGKKLFLQLAKDLQNAYRIPVM